jgi:hypothetical protein
LSPSSGFSSGFSLGNTAPLLFAGPPFVDSLRTHSIRERAEPLTKPSLYINNKTRKPSLYIYNETRHQGTQRERD